MANIDDLRIDLPFPKPRRRGRFSWGGLAIIVALLALALWLFGSRISDVVTGGITAPREVETFVVAGANETRSGGFTAGGYLEAIPPGPVVVSALVGGRVESLEVIPGQAVSQNAVVARLDAAVYKQRAHVQESKVEIARRQLALIEAGFRAEEIEEAEADLIGHRAERDQVGAEYRRNQELFEQGVTAELAHEKVRARYEQARAEHRAAEARLSKLRAGSRAEDIALARAELAAAEVTLEQLNWEIEQCVIRSPVGGVVYAQFTQPGSWVEPGTDDRFSSALISVFDPIRIQAWVDVNQRDSAGLYVGQQAWLTTDAYAQRRIAGEVIQIMPAANLQKNTIQAKLSISDPPTDFRPELSVKIEFFPRPAEATGETETGIPIPARAMVLRNDQTGVYVINDGIARWRSIDISGGDGEIVRVIEGLSSGERIVVDSGGVKDGQTVTHSSRQDGP